MAYANNTLSIDTDTDTDADTDADADTDTKSDAGTGTGTGTCTVVVSLRDSPGALGRIAASLSSTPVLALAYVVTGSDHALAEIRLPRAHATRARNKLNRMVDTLCVSEPQPAVAASRDRALPGRV
ncbi:hypothetical protein [Streptomyces sp. NPDC058955]|uniref:hypothetical protein n=1 Tax=unclassified Streptomyces TaxID=2593676 RepID=UPI0036664E04